MTQVDRLRTELGLRYRPDSVASMTGNAGRFVRWAGEKPAYTRDDIIHYFDHLLAQGLTSGSVGVALTSIKALCRSIACPWPMGDEKIHLPAAPDPEEGELALEPDEVRALIRAVKPLPSLARKVTALSSLYGFRISELVLLVGATSEVREINMATSKGRRRRQHGIPELARYAVGYPPVKSTRVQLHQLFRRLMAEHVRKPEKGEGWHSLRRSLATGLIEAGVNEHVLDRYMGWKPRTTAGRYNRAKHEDIDAIVYPVHPFLAAWRQI